MGVPATTTEATISAIQESLLQLSATLGRMAAKQDQMLVDWKKKTAALVPTTTTTPMFVSTRVGEQTTKPSSSSLSSAIQVVGAGAPHADAVFAAAMPTRCSTVGSAANIGNDHVVVVSPSWGNTQTEVRVPYEPTWGKAGPLPVPCRPPEQPHGTVFADGQVSLASQPKYDLAEDVNGLELCWKLQAGTSCHRIWWIAKNHYKIMSCVGKNTYCKQYGTYLADLATTSVALVAVLRSTSCVVQFSMIWDPGITEGFMGVPYSLGNTIGVCPSACRETVMQQFMNSDHLNSLASYAQRQCTTPSLVQLQNFIRGNHQFAVEVGLSTSKYFCCLELSVKPKVEINGVTILCVELHVYSTCAWLSSPWKPGLHTWLWCCCRRHDRQVHNSIYGCDLFEQSCTVSSWPVESWTTVLQYIQYGAKVVDQRAEEMLLYSWIKFNIRSVHYFCSIFAQSIICTLGRPWDPGIVAIREWQVQGDISAEVGAAAAICDRIDRAIAWGQAMFLGGSIVTPDTWGKVGLGFMGRVVSVDANKWEQPRQEEGMKNQNRTDRGLRLSSPSPFVSSRASSSPGPAATTSPSIPLLTPRSPRRQRVLQLLSRRALFSGSEIGSSSKRPL